MASPIAFVTPVPLLSVEHVRVRLPEGKPAHCHVPKVCDE